MRIKGNGNVGIGYTTPAFPLSFNGALGDKICLWTDGTPTYYGMGIQNSLLQIFSKTSLDDIGFGFGSSTAFTERMRVKGNGNVGIGTTAPGAKLEVNGSIRFTNTDCINGFCPVNNAIRLTPNLHLNAVTGNAVIVNWDNGTTAAGNQAFRVGNGGFADVFYVNYGGNAWLQGTLTQTSDSRLKKEIQPLQSSLEKLLQLNGYTYHWKSKNFDSSLQTGVIAQEVQKIFPQLVKEDSDGILAVNYSGLIPVLIESIKEQQLQIEKISKHDREQQLQIDELKKILHQVFNTNKQK